MYLSEILNLVLRRLPYSLGIFLITFLILSNSGVIADRYILERNVEIGTHLGSSNFPSTSNFINIVNSAEFKLQANLENASSRLESIDSSLIVTFKGSSEESLIAASKSWIGAINEIEEKLWKEKSIVAQNILLDKYKAEIEFLENYNPRFSTQQTLEELALVNILNDKYDLNNWSALNNSRVELRKEMQKETFVPTKYFIEGDGKVIRYFPNRFLYIGCSLIAVVFYYLSIIGLYYRRKSQR